jgi:uncharacterized protein YcfJ
MKKIVAACFSLALAPATAVLAVDTGAVIGGAVGGGVGAAVGSEVGGKTGAIVGGAVGGALGAAVMADDDERSSSSRTRVIHVHPSPKPEEVYAELPPPPKVIYVQDRRYKRVPPGHAKHWKKHKSRKKIPASRKQRLVAGYKSEGNV